MVFHTKTLLGGGGSAPGTPLTRDEEKETERKLRMLTADPINAVFEDREFKAFKTKQFECAFPGKQKLDATGRGMDTLPVVRDVEPFEPTLRRDNLDLSGAVGEDSRNRPSDVIKVKKALSNTGLFDFDVTKEKSTDAGPMFRDATKAFQRLNGIEPDGCIRPDCPTKKALNALFFPDGSTNSKASPVDLRPAVARVDAAATGAGSALLAKAGVQPPTAGGSPPVQSPGDARMGETEVAVHMRPPKGLGRGGGSGKPPRSPLDKIVEDIIDKIPKIDLPEAKPEKAEKPAEIIAYPDGRRFLLTDPLTRKPIVADDDKALITPNPKNGRMVNNNLPPSDSNAANENKTNRQEGSVVVRKFNEDGSPRLWLLVDPESGQPLRVPEPGPKIFTPEQIKEMGLSEWDTSRRSGLDFDDATRLLREFGPAVVNEVFKRLFLTRGTGTGR